MLHGHVVPRANDALVMRAQDEMLDNWSTAFAPALLPLHRKTPGQPAMAVRFPSALAARP